MCGNLTICWEGLLANSAVFREKPCGILCMCIYMIYTRIRVYTHIYVYMCIYTYIYIYIRSRTRYRILTILPYAVETQMCLGMLSQHLVRGYIDTGSNMHNTCISLTCVYMYMYTCVSIGFGPAAGCFWEVSELPALMAAAKQASKAFTAAVEKLNLK